MAYGVEHDRRVAGGLEPQVVLTVLGHIVNQRRLLSEHVAGTECLNEVAVEVRNLLDRPSSAGARFRPRACDPHDGQGLRTGVTAATVIAVNVAISGFFAPPLLLLVEEAEV